MTERKAVIKNADMAEEMQTDAIDCAANVRRCASSTLEARGRAALWAHVLA